MAKALNVATVAVKSKKKNKGVHAKTKTSKAKGSKNYNKPYNRQGK